MPLQEAEESTNITPSYSLQGKEFLEDAGEGVRVCLLGTGWALKVQLPQFRAAGLEVVGLYSRSEERGRELASKHGVTHAFTTPTAACGHPDVQLVSIVTPVDQHVEHFKAALEAGKHVLLDKPMCLAGQADELLRLQRQHPQQVVVVDHELRFTPGMLRLRQLLREGAIGKVRLVECRIVLAKPTPQWTWWEDRKLGGGCFGAFGSHMLDSFRFILDAEVEAISALLEPLVKELPDEDGRPKAVTADSYASCRLRLVPGDRATPGPSWQGQPIQAQLLLSSVGCGKPANGFTITGEHGLLQFSPGDGSLTHQNRDGKVLESTQPSHDSFSVTGTRYLGRALQRALGPLQDAAALANAATLEDGVATQYVMDAGWESSDAGGKWVKPKRVQPA